jgi:hypothetical protein
MPTRELIMKIAALAGDERGDPMVRAVACEKLAVLKDIYPHLFWMPDGDEPAAQAATEAPSMWADVADVSEAPSPPPPARYGSKAWFMDIKNWDTTAKGNPSIVVMAKGVELRVVLFRYKKAPTQWGFLLIDTRTDATTFSDRRYSIEIAAHEGAWEELCAI